MQQDTPETGMQTPPHDTFDFGRIFRTLWNGKFILAIFFTIAVAAGGYYAYVVATPIYSAASVLVLNSRQEQVVDLEGVIGGLSNDNAVLNTEVEVLRSRELIGKVVDQLDLVSDPEFNATLSAPTLMSQVRSFARELFRGAPLPDVSDSAEQERRIRDAVITEVAEHIWASNLAQSLVFRISVRTTDGTKSARMADALADAYILNQIEVKFDATEQATSWLTERVADLQVTLEDAENAVKGFRAGTELINADGLQALEVQLKTLRDRIRDTEDQSAEDMAQLTALEAADTPEAQAQITGDAVLLRLLPQIDTRPANRTTFDQRFETLRVRAENTTLRNSAQLESLTVSVTELEGQRERQSADLILLQQLEREAEASRLLYEYFLNRLKETSAQQGIQQADSRILSRAVVPYYPSEPRKSLILLVSGFLGLLLGSALLFLREFSSSTVRVPEDLERITGYPVIGQITRIPVRKRNQAIAYLAEKPASVVAEAVRNLRTSVLLSNIDKPPQIIMLSSSLPGEGKTTLSLALAQNFAGMGKKTLLIEGDMRRQVFGQYMDTGTKGGLVAVMSEEATLDEAIYSDKIVGADILSSGITPANPADLLSSKRFAAVLDELRKRYDQIIIDTPPVLVVPDARIIAQHVDASVFVVKWDSTSIDQVVSALRSFESAGHRVRGVALNNINPKGLKRYGYGKKYGAYAAYGSKYYVN